MKLRKETVQLPDGTTGTVEFSSGNVFADLGLPNPEECLLKAQLASQINELIKSKKLTQTAAAKMAGVSQPKISEILRGRLTGYSVERLLVIISRLGRDVEVRISKKDIAPAQGQLSVTVA